MTGLFEQSGAIFSPCGTYRMRLWRRWGSGCPAVFCMLNPSTADATANDPTVERCERRARAMGFGGLEVINLFALRSTDPRALRRHDDPIGPGNDAAILEACGGAGIVICAWGAYGALMSRGECVHELLRSADVQPHILELNRDGTPKHPLYVGYDVQPKPWKAA